MYEKIKKIFLIGLPVLFTLSALGTASSSAETPEPEYAPGQRTMTAEEYLEEGGEEWFLTGKKEYCVQAMMVSGETTFHNELEVVDYTVTDDGVTVVLKGMFGEMWTSSLSKVMSAYTKTDGSALSEEDFAERDTYIDIKTRPQPDSCYAMYVPLNISVTAETAWGNVLHTNLPNAPHGDGDYLVCSADEDGRPDLSDIWVLNGVVFPEYYDTSHRMDEAGENAA